MDRRTPKRMKGLSLIELLVGMVIALICIVVIFDVFGRFEGQRRTTSTASDTQSNGNFALYMMERDIRMAGYGLNSWEQFGCQIEGHDSAQSGPTPNLRFSLTPIQIVQGASGAPDMITVMSGSATGYNSAGSFIPVSSSSYSLASRSGVFPGDLVVAVGPGIDSNLATQPANGLVCQLAEVNQLPTAPGQTDLAVFDGSTSYVNNAGVTVAPTHNPSGGLGVTFSGSGALMNLGPTPRRATYSITAVNGGSRLQLASTDLFTGLTTPVADEIIDFQAQYGLDNGIDNGTVGHSTFVADDGILDQFVDSLPANPTTNDWSRVLAVRVALLARSTLPEKADPATGICNATSAIPTWGSGTNFVNTSADWRCYRYRVLETVVPMRNVIWKQ